MDTRRAILWVIFSISLLMLWDAYMRHTGRGSMFGPPAKQAESVANVSETKANPGAATTPAPAATPAPAPAPVAAVPAPAQAKGQTPGVSKPAEAAGATSERITLRNKDIELEIDSLGARIIRAVLIREESEAYEGGRVVLFEKSAQRQYEAQTGLVAAAGTNKAFPNHTTSYRKLVQRDTTDGGKELSLVAESGGVKLTKTYTLDAAGYAVRVTHNIQNTGADTINPQLYLQLMRDGNRPPGESQFYQTFIGPAIYTEEGKFQKIDFSDIEKNKASHVKAAKDGWVGIIQHYFVAAWISKNNLAREFYTRKVDNNLYAVGVIQVLPSVAPGAQQSHEAILFAGPQLQRTLEQLAPGLDLVVDYGWLTFLAKPIYWLLEKLHDVVIANWGWAIVLLTIIIKLIFYPLSAASYKSMAKMKAVSPRLMKLRELYGNDKAKMNQAMMELYKTEKINPLGGCLPIVIQIPVFIALYWVLLASVEMRNAPWLGWITDLSTPDPYFILPVIMAITMFIQTKLNPPPPDPLQAKVMMAMPIVFSVFFFFFPAGLVLYWLVNNILSIAQQWYVMRQVNGAAAAKS